MRFGISLLAVLSLLFFGIAGEAFAVGYAATTVYGTVTGEGKWSLTVTAEDMVTGDTLPAEFKVEDGRFLCAVTAPDDGHRILFTLRFTTREGEEVRRIESLPWGATEIMITLPEAAGEPEIAVSSGGGGGPRYDDQTRDSEGSIDDFVTRYNVTRPPGVERPELLPHREAVSDEAARFSQPGDESRKLVALIVLVSSISGILLLLKRKK